jgi:hypothetical protein
MKEIVVCWSLWAFCSHASAEAINCQLIGAQLNELTSADQQIRQEWLSLERKPTATPIENDALQERWRSVDRENLKQLKAIILACGWPKEKAGSHSAWLLAQHADSDVAFQRQARDLLAESVKAGIAAPRDLAYVADRIAANEGRPQEYGTQFSQPDRCTLKLKTVDDIELVKRRRLAIGLRSLEEYEAEVRRGLIPSDCPK